jgi:predicted secreted protein
MGIVSGLVTFLVIWWLVLFVVLPFGVQTQEESGGAIEPCTPASAPARSGIGLKAIITTGIAALLWSAVYVVMKYEVITIG